MGELFYYGHWYTNCNDSLESWCLDLFVKIIMELFENTTAFFNHRTSAYYVCVRMNK